jgi:hypothetical protein
VSPGDVRGSSYDEGVISREDRARALEGIRKAREAHTKAKVWGIRPEEDETVEPDDKPDSGARLPYRDDD